MKLYVKDGILAASPETIEDMKLLVSTSSEPMVDNKIRYERRSYIAGYNAGRKSFSRKVIGGAKNGEKQPRKRPKHSSKDCPICGKSKKYLGAHIRMMHPKFSLAPKFKEKKALLLPDNSYVNGTLQ